MTFGFNLHIVCGRIASINDREVNGTKVTNVRILAKSSSHREEPFWIDASVWGKNGELFRKSAFKRGDKISVSLSTLKQCVWQDKFGKCHSSLLGNVDKYWDLRSGPRDDELFLREKDKLDKVDKMDKAFKADKMDQAENLEQVDKADKAEKADKSDKMDQADKVDQAEKADKAQSKAQTKTQSKAQSKGDAPRDAASLLEKANNEANGAFKEDEEGSFSPKP
jgi:hypothetical protein